MGRPYRVRFAVIGDIHWGEGGTDYTSRLPALVTKLNSIRLDFVIFAGDVIIGHENIDSFVSTMNSLTVPWHYVPGNHDNDRNTIITRLGQLGINASLP